MKYPRGNRYLRLLATMTMALSAPSFGQVIAAGAFDLPLGTQRIIGDRISVPRRVYKVKLPPGTRLDITVSGGLNTVGAYDLSLYLPDDSTAAVPHLTCITRAFSDAMAGSAGNHNKAAQSSASVSCKAHVATTSDETRPGIIKRPSAKSTASTTTATKTSTPTTTRETMAKRATTASVQPVKSLVRSSTSEAQIDYIIPTDALYYIVVEFYGVGVQLKMNTRISN